jgi:hypothetical protein
MINTKNLVTNDSSVPSFWVFQYYLNLNEHLNGQDIKIKSILFGIQQKERQVFAYM